MLRSHRSIPHVFKRTKEEDDFLKEGIAKHGFGQWTAILRDDDFQEDEQGWNENGPSLTGIETV